MELQQNLYAHETPSQCLGYNVDMPTKKTLGNTKYWVYNDDPKLPTIIMIHGLRGTHHGLSLIAEPMKGYRVIIPDLPGFGESSPMNGEHNIEHYAIWLKNFISGLKLSKPPFLMGHSFGSVIVSYYAKDYPKTISKLILVNPIGLPALEGAKAVLTQIAVAFYWLGRKLPEPAGSKLLASKTSVMIMSMTLAKTHDKKKRKFIHDQHLKYFSTYANREIANEAFQASIRKSVREVAPYIKVPTLLIAGELDDMTPVKKERELAKLFPNATLIVIDKVGHLTHYETPDTVRSAIEQFAV
jgi:pimeloyl-ACP methyl ester carboxylesterase